MDSTVTVIFPAAGNFKLVCLVHENHTGTVHVLDVSEPLPHDQAFYDKQAASQRHELLSDARNDAMGKQALRNSPQGVTAGTGEVTAKAGGSNTLSVMRFSRDNMQIQAGQTVEWDNQDPVTPHTITFGPDPADLLDPSPNVTVDPDGARHAIIGSTSDTPPTRGSSSRRRKKGLGSLRRLSA